MAFQASFASALFHLFMAFDAGPVGGSVRPCNHLLMDNVTMTVDACKFRLLNVQSMGKFNIAGNLFPFFLDILMTMEAVLIDEFTLCRKFVGE